MPTDIIIRPAAKEDLNQVRRLVKELATYEKAPEAVTATAADYDSAFSQGLIHIIVAQSEAEIIGMALYYDTFSTWKGKMLYLEDFVVKEAYRNQGIGQQLFDETLNQAKKRGCKMMKWQILDWNNKAIEFYKRNNATIESEWLNGKILFE